MEQAVLGWWRNDLGLPIAYPPERMPQEGYTETAPWEDIHPLYVLAKVDELANIMGMPHLLLHPERFFDDRAKQQCHALGPRAIGRQSSTNQPLLELGSESAPPTSTS